jgi:hypothetical protein
VFGAFMPRLTLLDAGHLALDIPQPGGSDRQVVDVAPVLLPGNLLLLSWTERDGTVVFHVHDYARCVVHSHARLPDGTLLRSQGEIRWA